MTARTDPETYLRVAWERIVIADEQRRHSLQSGAVGAASRLLVAAGTISADRADAIRFEYEDALRLRAGHLRPLFFPGSPQHQRIDLSIRRVVLCSEEFGGESNPRTLRQAIFTDDAIELEVSGIEARGMDPMLRRRAGRIGQRAGGHPNGLAFAVRDDSGAFTTAVASQTSFSGRNWEGQFKSSSPLSEATRWIEIDGNRIDLPDPRPSPPTRIEKLDEASSLRRAIGREITNDLQMHAPATLEFAIAALVETRTLAPDDPLIAETEAISAAIAHQQSVSGLAEPWASLLARIGKSDGPVGRVAIGAVADVEGISIRLDSLASERQTFSVSLAVSPGWALLRHGPRPQIGLSPIEWWADDNRGNRYLFATGNAGGSDQLAEGIVQSIAPLDPSATELRLTPTGQRERAVVTLALAELAPG